MAEDRYTGATETKFTIGRDLGFFGRLVRLLAGVIPLILIGRVLITNPEAAADWPTFVVRVALYFLAVAAVYFLAFYLLQRWLLGRLNPWISTLIFYGPVFVIATFGLGPTAFQLGLSLYVAISLLFNVGMNYGGCEVVSIPSLILGGRYAVYCPWNAVDVVETAVGASRTHYIFKLSTAVIIFLVGGHFLLALLGLYELVGLDVPIDDRLVLLFLVPILFFIWNTWLAYQESDRRLTAEVWWHLIAALVMGGLTVAFLV